MMFPSQGFFDSVSCPDYLEGKCSRNYCHFNHTGKVHYDLKSSRSSASTFSEVAQHQVNTCLISKSEKGTKCGSVKNDSIFEEAAVDSHLSNGNKVKSQENVGQFKTFETHLEAFGTNYSTTNHFSPHYTRPSSSSSDTTDVHDQGTKPKEGTTDILQHLISEAVKKVLSENSSLNSAFVDPSIIATSVDTNSIIREAVKEISYNSSLQESFKEKKQPRLYLPPPGTPSYKPTPISQLQEKSLKVKPSAIPSLNEEYTPTSVANAVSSNDGEITDFSAEEDENENEAKSEFDILEEVLVESSSDPSRKKAILKRKKALGKLASTSISSKSVTLSKTRDNEDKNGDSKDAASDHSASVSGDTFHPPSPIFTSSSDSNMGIYTLTNFKVDSNAFVTGTSVKEAENCNEGASDNSNAIIKETDSLPSVSKSHSLPISSTHNLLPQIAELSWPTIKSWSPIAKTDSLLSVEKMLEQLDSVPNKRKQLLQGINVQKVLDPQNNQKDGNLHTETTKLQSHNSVVAVSQSVKDPKTQKFEGSPDAESCLQNDGQEKTPERKKQNENESSSHQKRLLDSANSSDAEKRKKMSTSRKKQKKHRRSTSLSSSDASYSSESDSEEESSEERHSEKRKKRRRKRSSSKHQKHKSKKRKSKYKKKKNSKSRSKSSHRKSSHRHSSIVSGNTSSSNSEKSLSQSQLTLEGSNKILLDESEIKKENFDPDLSIVKIEKVISHSEREQMNLDNPPLSLVTKSCSNVSHLENTSKELSGSKLLSFQASKNNSGDQNSVKTCPNKEDVFPSEESKTMSANVCKSKKGASKPKILKEFSIFKGLTEVETLSKKTARHQNSSCSKSVKTPKHTKKEGSTRRSSKEKEISFKASSHSTRESKSKELDKQSKDRVQPETSYKKHNASHSTEKSKDKKSSSTQGGTSAKENPKSSSIKIVKKSEKHTRKGSSSDKASSSSSSKSKLLKSEIKSYKGSFKHKTNKSKEENSLNNVGSSRKSLPSKELESLGSDSPIPDLSALDEIPKEDWDQLLAGSLGQLASSSDTDEGIDYDPGSLDDSMETDDVNDPKVLEECMKVFSEYNPKENPQPALPKRGQLNSIASNEDVTDIPTRKARVAYSGASGNLIAKPKALVKPLRKTPAEVMLERYRKLKEEEMLLKKKLEFQRKELEKHGQMPPSMAISSPAISSTSDSPHAAVSSSTSGLPKKRVARAPSNVSALLKSKEKLMSNAATKRPCAGALASEPEPKTIAMTNAKGQKRVAHIPKLEALQRPIISTEAGTKVPQNIRQRYLNCFIDETLKFCDGEEHAFNVALAEESICHKKAATRMVYLNLAVNVLKRLRTSQISEAAQDLLENDQKYSSTKGRSISHSGAVSSSSSSSCKKRFEHPVNPNHCTVSHFSVMASGGQKGTWSIQKSKRSLPDNINDYLMGPRFYKLLKKYMLTEEQLAENGFPFADPTTKGKAIIKKLNIRKKVSPCELERYCDRCSVLYEVDQWGFPAITSSCVYHWGRAYKCRGIGGLESRYSCCQGDSQSEGCCLASTHVSENFMPDSLKGYVRTIPKEPDLEGDFGVFALDCEMCYTTGGSELTRITVIDSKCKSVYETLVKPENPVIDYNTRFSGITEEDLEGVTVSLRDVQAALLTRFSEKTILMGHSLESDFSALKLIHETVVDTSVEFPHKLGPPFKRALRNLASEYLAKIIQNDEGGHDSAEDAITCMELMHWKVKEDLKGHL